MKPFRRLARSFAILSLLLVSLAGVTGGLGYLLWKKGLLQPLIIEAQNRLVETYFERIRKDLPFEIEKIEVKKSWPELLIGKVSDVSLIAKKDGLRAHLQGPLHFPPANLSTLKQLFRKMRGETPTPGEQETRVDYYPIVRIDGVSAPSPFHLHLWAVAAPQLNRILEIGIETEKPMTGSLWRWQSQGLEIQAPKLRMIWKNDRLESRLDAETMTLSFKDGARERSFNLVRPSFRIGAPMSLDPFSLGPAIDIGAEAQNGEALWGERYFSAQEQALFIDGKISLASALPDGFQSKGFPLPGEARLAIGRRTGKKLHVDLAVPSGRDDIVRARWKLDGLPLNEALPAFLASTSSAGAPFSNLFFLKEIDPQQGRVSSNGELRVRLKDSKLLSLQSRSSLEDAGFFWPKNQLGLRGLHLQLPFSLEKGLEGEISVGRIAYRKFRGRLKPTRLSIKPIAGKDSEYSIRFGNKGERLPLDVDGLQLRLDSITGGGKLPAYELKTSLDLEPTALEKILTSLCSVRAGARILPATVRMGFPEIEISPGVVDLTGSARMELFDGFVEADEMAVFDLFTEVPEFDFNVKMERIRLDRLGEWLGFGEMDGILQGYAKEVVFQSWLPTQYDLRLEAKPLNKSDIVFSPDAMKNVARLFAEDGIDQIPGFAQWFAFGWPSRVLLGGYDIDYAGIQVKSEDGFIKLETLDPVKRASDGSILETPSQNRFILYGKRFKMPLRSSRYPLVLDAAAMGNFVRRKLMVLSQIAKKKNQEKNADANLETSELADDDSLPPDCVPSRLFDL